MRIDVNEAGTPEASRWADEWFDRWFATLDEALGEGRRDPIRYMLPEMRVSFGRSVASERRFALSLVDDAGEVLGAARVSLPQLDNKELAGCEVYVPAARRRRGYGTTLLRAVRDVAAQHGRTVLQTDIARPLDVSADQWPGTAFAAATGFAPALTNVRRDLPLPADAPVLAGLRAEAEAASAGYDVRVWKGRTPPEHLDEMAGLMARMSTDAPLGELDYEPEAWDAARVEEFEDYQEALGRQWWVAVAVAPDGAWAGYTYLGWTPNDPERLYQWDTLVLTEHRGRRLGLRVKLEALAAATREWPHARVVTTWNAGSNAPMIDVNEAMGFRAVEADEEWQAAVAELRL